MDGLTPTERPIPDRHRLSRVDVRRHSFKSPPQLGGPRLTELLGQDGIIGDRGSSHADEQPIHPAAKSYSGGKLVGGAALLIGLITVAVYFNVKLGLMTQQPADVAVNLYDPVHQNVPGPVAPALPAPVHPAPPAAAVPASPASSMATARAVVANPSPPLVHPPAPAAVAFNLRTPILQAPRARLVEAPPPAVHPLAPAKVAAESPPLIHPAPPVEVAPASPPLIHPAPPAEVAAASPPIVQPTAPAKVAAASPASVREATPKPVAPVEQAVADRPGRPAKQVHFPFGDDAIAFAGFPEQPADPPPTVASDWAGVASLPELPPKEAQTTAPARLAALHVAPLAPHIARRAPALPLVAIASPPPPASLPADVALHLRIVYALSSATDRARIDALATRLRRQDSEIASAAASVGPAPNELVVYYFPNDRAGASRIAASLAQITGQSVPLALAYASPLPRPGTVEIRLPVRVGRT